MENIWGDYDDDDDNGGVRTKIRVANFLSLKRPPSSVHQMCYNITEPNQLLETPTKMEKSTR